MKKSLLATTALAALGAVAVAGPATAAEKIKVSVGGYMEQWFGYADSKNNVQADADGFDQQSDGEIFFKGSTTLDNGIKVGINVQLEGQSEDQFNRNGGDQIDEQFAYIEGSFGRVIIGSENAATYLMHYGIPSHGAGIDSGDVSSWIANVDFTAHTTNGRGPDNDAEKITYFTPRFSGFQLGASYTPEVEQDVDGFRVNRGAAGTLNKENNGVRDDAFSVAANFNRAFGDVKVKASAGYSDFGDDDAVVGDQESYQFALHLGFGGFGVAGTYGENDRAPGSTMETIGVGLNYAAGPFGVSLGYIGAENDDIDDEQDAFELGMKYKLGPGVEARGSVFYAEREVAGVETAEGFAVIGGLKLGF